MGAHSLPGFISAGKWQCRGWTRLLGWGSKLFRHYAYGGRMFFPKTAAVIASIPCVLLPSGLALLHQDVEPLSHSLESGQPLWLLGLMELRKSEAMLVPSTALNFLQAVTSWLLEKLTTMEEVDYSKITKWDTPANWKGLEDDTIWGERDRERYANEEWALRHRGRKPPWVWILRHGCPHWYHND